MDTASGKNEDKRKGGLHMDMVYDRETQGKEEDTKQ